MYNNEKDRQRGKLPDEAYWNAQWENQRTGWDIGYPAPAITEYMARYIRKDAAILIPGCGNAYEAEYLVANGFTNITLLDIAPRAVQLLEEKFADRDTVRVLCGDFFRHEGNYDLMVEQTFFCALPVDRRKEYVAKAASLLKDNGAIVGLLFNRTFEQQGPPFGGTAREYELIFAPYFTVKTMAECPNSIPPRAGTELFIDLVKKEQGT